MSSRFIFLKNQGFLQCHGSTVVVLPDGRIMSAWFAGTREKNPDTAIWFSVNEGGKWSAPHVLIKLAPDLAHWNPVLFLDPLKKLHLWFKMGVDPEHWETFSMESDDYSKWSGCDKLCPNDPAGGRGPVRGKPIVLSNGDWLAPASVEKVVGMKLVQRGMYVFRSPDQVWNSFADITSDRGKTWTKSIQIPYDRKKWGELGGIIQPSPWESKSGNVHMLLRSMGECLFRSDSSDYGRTWSESRKTDLPNPNSAVDVADLGNGLLALVLNPVRGNWIARTPLTVVFSRDNGETWNDPLVLEDDPNGSFGYPSMIPWESRGLVVSYSWNRTRIACVGIEVDASDDEVESKIVDF
jgi:predicted neuraminidase